MLGDKVTIISTIFLLGALFSIGMTGNASAVTVDGVIGGGEYAHSVVVDKTPDLLGVYDPNGAGSFDGEPFAFGHGDWTLFWDFDATNIYIAAEPIGSFPSHPAESNIGIHLVGTTGDPNTGVGLTDCTGTFFSLLAHQSYFSFTCNFLGDNTFTFSDAGPTPLSAGEIFKQDPIGTTITPIEWNLVRADLVRPGDTTYTGDLQCVWFKASAFDSRSVDNPSQSGVRTIWLKLDPTTPPCVEESAADHFLGYDAKTTKKTPKFQKVNVFLSDQFQSGTYKVEKTKMFFTPVDKNGEGIADSDTHLKGYKIKGPHTPVSNIVVTNQFGELLLNTVKVELLLVPTLKDLNEDISDPLLDSLVDHYLCYKVEVLDDQRLFNQVSLQDQFISKDFTVGKPKMLCNPVDKNGEGINDPDNHLMCYEIKDKFKQKNIHTHDQFGPETLDTKKIKVLCVPSMKTVP